MKIEIDLRKNLFPVGARFFPVGALLLLPVGALCKRALGAMRGWKPRLRGLVCISILMLFFLACADRNTPQAVSEDFIYNYYQRADQGAALLLTDLLAAEKLQDELARVQGVRMPGQLVDEMPKIEYKQLARQDTSEDQVLFNYELRIKPRGMAETTRNVVLNTELINGQWKVVNFDEY